MLEGPLSAKKPSRVQDRDEGVAERNGRSGFTGGHWSPFSPPGKSTAFTYHTPYLEVGPYLWSIRVSSVRIWQWVVVVLGQHEVRKHPLPRFRVCVLAQLNQGLMLVLTQPNGWQLGQLGEGYLKTKSEPEVAEKSGISLVTTARLKNLHQVLVVLQEGIE